VRDDKHSEDDVFMHCEIRSRISVKNTIVSLSLFDGATTPLRGDERNMRCQRESMASDPR
jgi:hypothetical protein